MYVEKSCIKTWLVVSTHLKNMSQNDGKLPQIGVKLNNTCLSCHHLEIHQASRTCNICDAIDVISTYHLSKPPTFHNPEYILFKVPSNLWDLHAPEKPTWPAGNSPCSIGNTSSKGPFSIAMLVYQSVELAART